MDKQDIFRQVVNMSDLRLDHLTKNEDFWQFICINFKLTEDFVREYKNIIDWDKVSKYQSFSMDFIREFKKKIDFSWYKWKLNKQQMREILSQIKE